MSQTESKEGNKTPRELFEEFKRQKPSSELIDGLREIKRNEEQEDQKEKDKQPESPERKIARPQTPPDLDL